MRLGALFFAWVLAAFLPFALGSTARASDAGGGNLVPLPRPPPAEPPPTVPSLEPPPDLSGLAGKAIVRIEVHFDGNPWDDVRVPPITGVRSGDPLTASVARRALGELLASGRFARAGVSARAEGNGAVLVLEVVPRKLIGRLSVDLHGAQIDREELLHQADLVEGGEIVATEVDAAEKRIEANFAFHGFPSAHAVVTVRETSDPMRALVLVDVSPGEPRIVGERVFTVFGARPDEVQRAATAYGVGVHSRADEPALDQADTALEQTLRGKGWYQAEVSHDLAQVRSGASAGSVVLRVRVDAGPLLVTEFEGNEHYDREVLTAVLGLDKETDHSPAHLTDKLGAFYQKRGFLDVEVRVELRGGDEPLQVAVFHIIEHNRVRVAKRSYPCLKIDAIKNLNGGGPRSPGDIGTEIDSYLDDELPGADILVAPDPRALSAIVGPGRGQSAAGTLPTPVDLRPDATYVASTYARAAQHVQELYRNEGFLHAEVGPVGVIRAQCDPRSPPQGCVPLPLPPAPNVCTYDGAGFPVPGEALPPELTCHPDPAHGIECAPTLEVVIPVKLGPRTRIWDVAFTGLKTASEREIADVAQVPLGEGASTSQLEDARRRIVDWYKEHGYYYVDVKYALEPSTDSTRARVRFDVNEGPLVIVRAIVIQGLRNTDEGVVQRRVALAVGQPYRHSDARKTQEYVSTLGVFSSVTVSLSDPNVPQADKNVIVTVVERSSQYVEVRPGFSTGEGVRGVLEYGHRNLLGEAWSMALHLQASYLPDFLILDQGVAKNYENLSLQERIATRDTLTFSWPEIGLGPTVRAQIDGVFVNDLERDFRLRKAAAVATAIWRPVREVQLSVSADYENNYVNIFDNLTIAEYIAQVEAMMAAGMATNTPDIATLTQLLRFPDGESNVVAPRVVVTWDRRDNAFNAHRGTYVAAAVEQVNSYPAGAAVQNEPQYESHFFRLTQTFAGYVPLTKTITFAAELRLGENITPWCFQRGTPNAPSHWQCTYPDRLFFMGGFDSMRGWLQDSFIPQDYVDQIRAGTIVCTNNQTNCPGVPVRGGNLMFNPRAELRFPIRMPIEGSLFADVGNLWSDPTYPFSHPFAMRADVGAGVRVDTPVGPLVFDYGINVTRQTNAAHQSYEDFGAFHFAIGLF